MADNQAQGKNPLKTTWGSRLPNKTSIYTYLVVHTTKLVQLVASCIHSNGNHKSKWETIHTSNHSSSFPPLGIHFIILSHTLSESSLGYSPLKIYRRSCLHEAGNIQQNISMQENSHRGRGKNQFVQWLRRLYNQYWNANHIIFAE